MRPITLSKSAYRDKVFACWLGKNIGGTLGAPLEGQKHPHDLDFYDPVPTEPTGNDDLDFQLVWLKMLEDRGVRPRLSDLAEYWVRYLSAYPWNEYGFCRRNLERGLLPPISGCFENYFVDEMGSSVRSEIWACIAPGDPQLAAAMAWKDAVLDHAGGEGVYGEMFWAAVESAAFLLSDPTTLIQIGLRMIPLSCGISRVVRESLWCRENDLRWAEARQRIATIFGHHQPCHTFPNTGFIILGWLYGKDYGDCLCKAVNCGYDTDSTGATLGALLGISAGMAGVPLKWRKPVGEGVVLHKFTASTPLSAVSLPNRAKFDSPDTIEELTDRTLAVGMRCLAERSDTVEIGSQTKLSADRMSLLFRNELALAALAQDVHSAVALGRAPGGAADGDVEMIMHYSGEPVLRPKMPRRLALSLRKNDKPIRATITVKAPKGWQVSDRKQEGDRFVFTLLAPRVPARNTLAVTANVRGNNYRASFTLLGPDEAKGYPATANVPTCPRCHAWKPACICPK